MVSRANFDNSEETQNEDEIFKSLTHQIRRNIIRSLGEKKELTFSDIHKKIGTIDSPTLSYHLKSLKYLIDQSENEYYLTDVGIEAYNLLNRITESTLYKKGKKSFMIANIITIVCWTLILFLVPFLISTGLEKSLRVTIIILLNVVAQINFQLSWQLWGRSWKTSYKNRRRKRKLKKRQDKTTKE